MHFLFYIMHPNLVSENTNSTHSILAPAVSPNSQAFFFYKNSLLHNFIRLLILRSLIFNHNPYNEAVLYKKIIKDF